MTRTVTIVDYGVGNLLSIARAVQQVGARAHLASHPGDVASADFLLLPGVGAFGHCARNLREAGFFEPVLSFIASGKPFLGICVGMQLLFDYSTEFGCHAGLGIIAGSVEPIPTDAEGGQRKVPHIGWSALRLPQGRDDWSGTALRRLEPAESAAYFVHSYSARVKDPRDALAAVNYLGFEICAAVQRDNVTGVQFHPEKSGAVGLEILKQFVS